MFFADSLSVSEEVVKMRVEDIMTRDAITLNPGDTIGQADEIMNEYRIRQIPIVDRKELLGIITDRDIRSFLSGRLFSNPEERERTLNTKVASVMTTKPISLSPEDDLRDAVELLIEEKIGGVPVVDKEEGVVGIVTYVDVLRSYLDRLEED